ncbi:MAG: hypothetical protein QNJ53_24450 [Pleurocapsa sp. MO_192.B19]|nr:hypothetical protein [Pleurocapsa sp. MO_192.B19]
MNNSIAAVAAESLQSFQKCKAFREKLLAEIETDHFELKKISEVKKYTPEIKKKKAKLEEKIKDKLINLEDVEAMLKFKPGDWVRNGSTRPGQVIEPKIAGRIPEVHVLWWQNTVPVPERPRLLKLIEPADLEYIWDAQQFPKLIRRIDRLECEDLEVLQKKYESSLDFKKTEQSPESLKICAREIVYCRKRFNHLTQEKFPPGIRVQLGSLFGTILEYPQTSSKSLIQVPIKLDTDEAGNHFVERSVSPVELINLGHQDHLFPQSKQIDKILDFCSHKPELKNIPIKKIKRDGGTQQRVALNHETVIEYAEAMKGGDRFPPVKLKYDGENYWLTDGFHTTEAAWSIGKTEIEAEVTPGTLREAILDSVAVNASHGLRRTNADKRRAVMTLLEDEEWSIWSNRKIAKACKVTEGLVRKLKKEIEKDIEQMNGCVQYAPKDLTGDFPSDNLKSDNEVITVNVHSDNPKTYKDTEDNCLIDNLKVGQIVRIKSDRDRSDKRLVGLVNSVALVTAINPASVDLKLFGQVLSSVSPNDIKPVELSSDQVTICNSFSHEKMALLLLKFNSIDEIFDIAIAAESLKI